MTDKGLGPRAFVTQQAEAFDRLLTAVITDPTYVQRREEIEEFDLAMHGAIHALKRLRTFADMLGPRWASIAERTLPPDVSRPHIPPTFPTSEAP